MLPAAAARKAIVYTRKATLMHSRFSLLGATRMPAAISGLVLTATVAATVFAFVAPAAESCADSVAASTSLALPFGLGDCRVRFYLVPFRRSRERIIVLKDSSAANMVQGSTRSRTKRSATG